MKYDFVIGIFAGVIVSILGNFLVTSFYKKFEPKVILNTYIFWVSAILFLLLILYFWIKYK